MRALAVAFMAAALSIALSMSLDCEAGTVSASLYSQYRDLGTVEIDAPAGSQVAWCYRHEVDVSQKANGRWITGFEIWCKTYTLDKADWILYYRQFPEENTI